MKRCICIIMVLLLCSCSNDTLNDELPQPSTTYSLPKESSILSPSPTIVWGDEMAIDDFDHVPVIRVSNILEEGNVIIADNDVSENREDVVSAYLYTSEPVYDILISIACEYTEEDPIEIVEVSGKLYVPELASCQAVKICNPYPSFYEDGENYFTQIAYTNSDGDYEVVRLLGDKEKENPSLSLIEPCVAGRLYEEEKLRYEYHQKIGLYSDDFIEKMTYGIFDSYVPKGFQIAGGVLGDVNGDGVEDALLCLMTNRYFAAGYGSVVPLFVLIGQQDGGYVVEKKIPEALFLPYRSCSYPVAGDGYIDIVYDYVGGAGCHHMQVCRFLYDPDKNDWVLGEFTYQPSFTLDYSERILPAFVHPLPSLSDLSIDMVTGNEYHESVVDWEYFDAICELAVQQWGGHNDIYTLAVKLDHVAGYYEGYIYMYYESIDQGGFIQTVRGDYDPAMEFCIMSNDDKIEFVIQDDIWRMDEHDSGAFHLVK